MLTTDYTSERKPLDRLLQELKPEVRLEVLKTLDFCFKDVARCVLKVDSELCSTNNFGANPGSLGYVIGVRRKFGTYRNRQRMAKSARVHMIQVVMGSSSSTQETVAVQNARRMGMLTILASVKLCMDAAVLQGQ